MKFPKSEKDFQKLMEGIKWNRIIPPLVSVLQPVIIFGLWLGFSKIDKRADAVSKLIAIAEPIPAIDLKSSETSCPGFFVSLSRRGLRCF